MTNMQKNEQELNLEKELKEITAAPDSKKVKRIDTDQLLLNGAKFQIVTDHKDALDLEMLEERYSEILEKYDYIVGDISYDKLRLRGFYEDDTKKVPIDMRISSLEDYLLEYCSFGCKYFVLKRLDPKKKNAGVYETPKKQPSRKRSRRPNRRSNKRRNDQNKKQTNQQKQPSTKQNHPTKSKPAPKKSPKKDFVQKEARIDVPKEKKEVKVKNVKDQKGNTRFQIRRKQTEETT